MRHNPLAQLILGAMAIGLAPIFVKLIVTTTEIGPISAGFWRMFIGALCFLVTSAISKNKRESLVGINLVISNGLFLSACAGVLFAMDLMAWHTSFGHTSVAASTIIANLSSIFVPLVGVLFFKERARFKMVFGAILAISGVLGLTLAKATGLRNTAHDSIVLGEGLAFMTAFFYTAYMLIIKKLTRKYSSRAIMLVSTFVSAIVLLAIALTFNQPLLPQHLNGWLLIFGLGAISQFCGQGLIASALSKLPVSQSALVLLSAPASTAAFAWVFIGETLSSGQLIAVAVTLVGIGFVVKPN